MINNAKKSAAVDSTYGYIEAIENYQAMEMLRGHNGLKEGKYNTVIETTLGEIKYKKLNDIVNLKGNKPTGGTVTILKNQTVGSAYLCINSYVVEYLNNEVNIVSDDCGEMGSIIEFVVDSEDYQINRTLTINYPKGNYEYYYKVNGKAKINDIYIEKDKEIKSEGNVSILLEENQTVEVWMIKNGKKIAIRKYTEEKIDNVEISNVNIKDTTAAYPLITSNNIGYKIQIELEYQSQEGTTPYYSVDDGKTWKKYTKIISEVATTNKIKAKMIRDNSKREGKIAEKEINVAKDAITSEAFDDDYETAMIYHHGYNNINAYDKATYYKYAYIDNTLWNSYINIKWYCWNYSGYKAIIDFIDENDKTLSTYSIDGGNTVIEDYLVPKGTVKLKYYLTNVSAGNFQTNSKIYEIKPTIYSIKDITKIEPLYMNEKELIDPNNYKEYQIIKGKYVNIQYKVNDEKYKDCPDKIKVNFGKKLSIKVINTITKEEIVKEINVEKPNTYIDYSAIYDKDEATYLNGKNQKFDVKISDSMKEKKVRIIWFDKTSYNTISFVYLDKDKNEIANSKVEVPNCRKIDEVYDIPKNAEYMQFYFGSDCAIFEIIPKQ